MSTGHCFESQIKKKDKISIHHKDIGQKETVNMCEENDSQLEFAENFSLEMKPVFTDNLSNKLCSEDQPSSAKVFCNVKECNVETKTENPSEVDEDYIIIENPDFISPQNFIPLKLTNTPIVNGVENDVLPPPRTLDDLPIRRRKQRSGKSSKAKKKHFNNAGLQSLETIIMEEIDKIEASNQSGSKECFENLPGTATGIDGGNDSQSSSHKSTHIMVKDKVPCSFKEDKESSLDNQGTSYNLRKKSSRTDYTLDHDLDINEEMIEEKYPCLECHFEFDTKKSLRNHQVTLHDHQVFACEKCGREFSSAIGLKRHLLLKHKQNRCPICNKDFKTKCTLQNHMSICGRLSSNDIEKTPRLKCFPCPHCSKRFSFKNNLARHIRLHKGILKYCCDLCGKKCSEKQALDSHIRYMHTGERPYNCNICFKSFTTNSDLRRHETIHSDERKYLCPECGKGFKTLVGLKTHIRSKRDKKLWQCGVCSDRFVTKSDLKAHMVRHSAFKMYECETCQRSFSHRQSLDIHMLVHSGLMPYVCPHCNKKFAHLQNRRRHVKTMHQDAM